MSTESPSPLMPMSNSGLFDYSSASPDSDSILSFTPMGTVEDFFNLDMLGRNGASSSRSSSKSPSSALWNLPPTPNMGMESIPEIAGSSSSLDPLFGDLYGDSSAVTKTEDSMFSLFGGSQGLLPSTISGADLFGMADSAHPASFAIDPSLTAQTPSSSGDNIGSADNEQSPFSLEDDEDVSLEEDDEVPELSDRVTGKKSKSRKGTVVSGGIRKTSSGPPLTQAVRRDDEPLDDDDWRPTPEEYKKMSSKEKRQLRNKISARNFRVRRKEYITTLEGDIAQRDNLIDAIRTELGSTKLENQSLRSEVEDLKRALLKGGITPSLPPPAPLSETVPTSVAANKENRRRNALAKPNTQKDLPSSPRVGGAFWGGRAGIGGGVTPVHTTLVPDFGPVMPDKLAARARAPLQENMNPGLNANPFYDVAPTNPNEGQSNNGFDSYTDVNPFTFKTMDAYRMHLWMRMGARANGNNNVAPQQMPSPPMQPQQQLDGLAGLIRPSFFSSPLKSSTPVSTLSGKASSEAKDVKPSVSSFTPQQAVIATIASQTFMQKLSSSFWDAFTSPTPAAKKDWDQEKVRKVLEGKAVLRVVDVPQTSDTGSVNALEESMRSLAIAGQGGALRSPKNEKLMMHNEPCFMQSLRAGTSALSGKK